MDSEIEISGMSNGARKRGISRKFTETAVGMEETKWN
jgi:hypothetical protein